MLFSIFDSAPPVPLDLGRTLKDAYLCLCTCVSKSSLCENAADDSPLRPPKAPFHVSVPTLYFFQSILFSPCCCSFRPARYTSDLVNFPLPFSFPFRLFFREVGGKRRTGDTLPRLPEFFSILPTPPDYVKGFGDARVAYRYKT